LKLLARPHTIYVMDIKFHLDDLKTAVGGVRDTTVYKPTDCR